MRLRHSAPRAEGPVGLLGTGLQVATGVTGVQKTRRTRCARIRGAASALVLHEERMQLPGVVIADSL